MKEATKPETATQPSSPWRTPKEAAAHVRRSPDHLARLRMLGTGPRFSKTDPSKQGRVVYHIDDLDSWLRDHFQTSTTSPSTPDSIG